MSEETVRRSRSTQLLEREHELAVLEAALLDARDGTGRVLVVEGAPGVGKSALLDAAAEQARDHGLAVLRARADEHVMPVAWSLVLALLGPAVAARSRARRRALLAGAAGPAQSLLSGEPASRPEAPSSTAAIAHALFWVVAGLAEENPLALLVDDAHWADGPSLHHLAHLAHRVAEVPVALVLTRHGPDGGLLDGVATTEGAEVLTVAPLSLEASAELVRRALGQEVDDELALACAQVTAGNPFYLRHLLAEVARADRHELDPQRVRTLTPAAVRRTVLVRLARLGPVALALAESVAILGDGFPISTASALAGLSRADAASALDLLVAAEILRRSEPLGFVHPLVASSIYAEIPIGRRGELHFEAARLLADGSDDRQLVGAQLLSARPRGESWAVELLRAAARLAGARGAPGAAADYLARALAEPPAAGERAGVLAELAHAEAAAGRPAAADRFESLLELAGDRAERARINLELGRTLAIQGRHGDALAAFARGLGEQGRRLDETGRELRAAYWMTKTMAGAMSREEMGELGHLVVAELENPTPGERALLAWLSMANAFQCRPREEAIELARRAWGDGALLAAETSDGLAWTLVTGALQAADELELNIEVCDRALADARTRGSQHAYATASYCRSGSFALQGRNDEAIADVEAALGLREDGWGQYALMSAVVLCLCRLEQGDLAGARRALAIAEEDPGLPESIERTGVMVARGELLLREGRPADALEQLESAGRILAPVSDYVVWVPWREGAVRALLMLDRRDRARELAEELVEHARRLGAPSGLARALRTLAETATGERALDLLEEAVGLFDGSLERREHAYALVAYGAALRRAGRRAAAREHLERGLAFAERGGLRVLAEQAREQLAAAGARTRRHTLAGVASLTPTERRVAELAAGDLANREIAQHLFVTVKTIEYHLANAYRKLGVRSRAGLTAALAHGSAADP